MDLTNIEGVILTELKKIYNTKGDIYHIMKQSSPGFLGFGEAYISNINQGDTKGWNLHKKMRLNLTVIAGKVRFILHDLRENSRTFDKFMDLTLSLDNYYRLTVPENIWVAFHGLDKSNMILNIADIEHNSSEAIKKPLEEIEYEII